VLKVVPTLRYGGTERQFMALSASLDPGRFQVDIACLRPAAASRRSGAARASGGHYDIGPFHSARTLALQTRFARDVARRRIDVVHAYNFYGNVFAVPPARLAGAPVVLASIRDCGPYLTPMQLRVQRLMCRPRRASWSTPSPSATGWWPTATIPAHRRDSERRGSRALPRAHRPGRRARQSRLAPHVPLVTVVSRVTRLKGLEEFICAASMLSEMHPRARFVVAGEPAPGDEGYLASLRRLAARSESTIESSSPGCGTTCRRCSARRPIAVMPRSTKPAERPARGDGGGHTHVATRVGGTPEAMTDAKPGCSYRRRRHGAGVRHLRMLDDPSLRRRSGTPRAAGSSSGSRSSAWCPTPSSSILICSSNEARGSRRHEGTAPAARPGGPALWLVVGRTVGFVATFAVPLVLVRLFDQATFGTYKQLFVIYATLFGLAQLGVAESLYFFVPKRPAEAGRHAANAIVTLALAGAGCAVAVTLAAPRSARWLSNPDLAAALPLLGVFLGLMLASALFEIVLVARGRYRTAAWTYAASDVLRAGFLVLPALIVAGCAAC
jgi:hypothetical protein